MKRIFTLITSIVLATSLLAVPCFAAEPEDLPTPQPGVTETEQPDGSDQPENPDRPSIQPCDAMPGVGDDRLYETNFPDIMMESEILAELQSKPLPDNVHAAFLKTCYNFADKMGLKLNLREHKQTHSYCWSTSSSSNVFYVDMNLKTYRCTCTVGRSRYSLFDFSYENLTNYRPVAVTCNSYAECKDCKIGGFCGGGCQLSHQIDFKKCCTYEEEVFSHFMKTLFIPYIKSKYNEVNQNERKAENRCT